MEDTPRNPQLALAHWRRAVAELYGEARRLAAGAGGPRAAWAHWRTAREALFAGHPQSPLPPAQREGFTGLPLFEYDPALRFEVAVTPLEDAPVQRWELGGDGLLMATPCLRTGGLQGALGAELTLFRLEGYGGGLFLPFADTHGQTYGGGRYLLDTIKGADLGHGPGGLVLDFNFAYNPSCAWSPQWVCPLAPTVNRLPLPIPAGEMAP